MKGTIAERRKLIMTTRKLHTRILATALLVSSLLATACGTLVGAGVGAAAGAIYDITR